MRRYALLLMAMLTQAVAWSQSSPDFAEKFVSLCKGDSTVKCITVSPKMMGLMLKQDTDDRPEQLMQVIAKLKSMRIVSAPDHYYQQAEDLLIKNSRRFQPQRDYRTKDQHGAFYTRKNQQGETIELILLHEDCSSNQFTIVNVTGDIDEEFLCFLYNNKTFKN